MVWSLRRAFELALVSCAVAAMLPAAARAEDKVTLRPAHQPGMAWTFTFTQAIETDLTASAGGQSQPVKQKIEVRRAGKAEVLSVARDGSVAAMRVTFGDADACQTSAQMNGQAQQPPAFPYAGRTITLKAAENGDVTDDFAGQADEPSTRELHHLIDQGEAMFPKAPVAVGEEWKGDPQRLARSYDLKGNDTAGMTLKLLSVKDVDGRPTAEVKVSTALIQSHEGMGEQTIVQGVALVDLKTGHTVKVDLKGEVSVRGDQRGPAGPDGQPLAIHVEAKGTVAIGQTAPFASAEGKGDGAPKPLPPTPNPFGETKPAAQSFTGKFGDANLTAEWADAGAGSYKGTLRLGQKTFDATGRAQGDRLEGTFESGGHSFPFTATLKAGGGEMEFVTGKSTYTLKKAETAVNPLDAK